MITLTDTHRQQLHRISNLLDGNARREIDGDASNWNEIRECSSLIASIGAMMIGTGPGEAWHSANQAVVKIVLQSPWKAGTGAQWLLDASAALNRVLAEARA